MGLIPKDARFPEKTKNHLLRTWSQLSDLEKRKQARMMAAYSAMMELQDTQIGLLLNYLEETGRRKNTLIIYLSDNGPEGLDDQGELSNPMMTDWIRTNFSQKFDDIGRGNSYGFIGTNFAYAATEDCSGGSGS